MWAECGRSAGGVRAEDGRRTGGPFCTSRWWSPIPTRLSQATDFTDSVTHVITPMDEQRWAETATMKMMYALATGTWIVSLDWLTASEAANCMVAEDKFVMQGRCMV